MTAISTRDFKPEELDQIKAAFAQQGQPATDEDLSNFATQLFVDRANAYIVDTDVKAAQVAAEGKKIPVDAAAVAEPGAEAIVSP